jgi:hypothetical protein
MKNSVKSICLIRGTEEESYQQFQERIFGSLLDRIEWDNNIQGLSVVLTVKKPPLLSVIPFKKDKIASISIKGQPELDLNSLMKEPGFSGIYQVDEAIPVAYQKTWKDTEATPGVNLLTLFRKKGTIDYETFIHRWHHGHTPLSLKIHPLWNYNRNVVMKNLADSSESWDGIVEEHFRSASDLLNPVRFFDNPLTMFYRMIQVYLDTRSFLDYPSMQTYLAVEYHLKSGKEIDAVDS